MLQLLELSGNISQSQFQFVDNAFEANINWILLQNCLEVRRILIVPIKE